MLDGQGLTLVDDVYDLHQNGPQVELDVLANDVIGDQYEGAGLITSVSFGSEGGRIEIRPDGLGLLYTPPADFAGIETFVYAVDGEHTANVRVSLLAPLAGDTFYVPPDGATVSLDVLANDPFWAGYEGLRQITSVSVSSGGSVVEIGADGRSINFTTSTYEANFERETFVYVVDHQYPAQVKIERPVPLVKDGLKIVHGAAPTTVGVLQNDPFWNGYAGAKQITHVTQSRLGGTVEISANGKSVIYAGPNELNPPLSNPQYVHDSFTYIVDGVYEQSVTVSILNHVRNDQFEVDMNGLEVYLDVLANEWLPWAIDRVTSLTQPVNGGSVTMPPEGSGVLYTPAVGFTGYDTFTYTVDGRYEARVTVNVTRPVRDDKITEEVYQDTPDTVLEVLANDFLGNGYAGSGVITSVGPTENGGAITIGADGKSLLYTPAAGYTGPDRLTYTVDGELSASATLHVTALAQNDSNLIEHYRLGQSFTYSLLGNDHFRQGYSGEGKVTSVEMVRGEGTFTFEPDGHLSFTPTNQGGAAFRYTVDGQYEALQNVWIASQTKGDHYVVDQNSPEHAFRVLDNDFKVYRHSYYGPRVVTGVSESAHGGVVTVATDGRSVLYTPAVDFYGRDSFTYSVDGFWTQTVTVEVIRRLRDDEFRVDSDDGAQVLPVLVNDLFGANYAGVGRITGVTAPVSGGVVEIAADGQSISYTPAPGFVGTDTFIYTVDGALKAEVRVVVDTPADERFPTFAGVDEYFEFLLYEALTALRGPLWPARVELGDPLLNELPARRGGRRLRHGWGSQSLGDQRPGRWRGRGGPDRVRCGLRLCAER